MNVLQLLDGSADWQHRVSLQQIHGRLSTASINHWYACIDRPGVDFRIAGDTDVTILPRRLGLPALAGPAIRSFAREHDIDLIHAWGVDAAVAARSADLPMPLAISQFDPGVNDRAVGILRTVCEGGLTAVVCAARRVERRLVERGVPMDACVVVRPGVDFACLRRASQEAHGQAIGLPAEGLTVLAAEGPASSMGHRAVIWSGLMHWYLDDRVRVLVPGESADLLMLRKLAESSDSPEAIVFTGRSIPFEDLVALADVLAVPTTAEIPATAIAWAMGAGATIIAAASYSTAEILSTNVNSVLYKQPSSWCGEGARICAGYQQQDEWPRLREVARGQAFEVFSVQRMVRQVGQLYRNLLDGAALSTGITDPAQLAS